MTLEISPAERVKARARELGFEAVGIARAGAIEPDFARYERFIAGGLHGEMGWLAESPEARARTDGPEILAGAKSVICVASSYVRSEEDEARDPPLARRIARYARGRDYHNGLRKQIRKLADFVRGLGENIEARPLCDDAPILERAWAARAGLGFVGKNGLLIVPGVGLFVLLGEVVTTLELEADHPMPERCGACTRCIDACPTGAIVEPFVVDARRCVSYLTIELRGSVPVGLREGIGEHLFGCDDCQTVCPFNHARRSGSGARGARPGSDRYAPLARWHDTSLEDLVARGDVGDGTPLKRALPEGIARNAAVCLGNEGGGGAALRQAAVCHASEVVRDAAMWALERQRGKSQS